MATRVKTSELWRRVIELRLDKELRAFRTTDTKEGAARYLELQASTNRAQRNALTAEVAEHWRTGGWHAPSSGLAKGAPTGRGWHDAHMPAKLP